MKLKEIFLSSSLALTIGFGNAHAAPILTNGDFSTGLTDWTTMNGPGSSDSAVVWFVQSPGGGSDPIINSGSSRDSASRVIFQDFLVPIVGVSSASFNFDYFSNSFTPLQSTSFTTFDNNPFSGASNNGTRIDILNSASDVFTGSVLFSLFAPTTDAVGSSTSLVSNTFADTAGLTAFLNSNAGNTLRLRIGNREESFPWDTGFDNINLDVTTSANVPAPAAIWLLGSGLIGLIGMRKKSTNLSEKYA